MLDELREAASQWEQRHRDVGAVALEGNGETVPGETGTKSAVMEMGTAEAAAVLGVTTRRVSQLTQAGILPGRKVGRTWLLRRPAVLDYRDAGNVA